MFAQQEKSNKDTTQGDSGNQDNLIKELYCLVKELTNNIYEKFDNLDRDVSAKLLAVQSSSEQLELKVNKLCTMIDDLKCSTISMNARLCNNELCKEKSKEY